VGMFDAAPNSELPAAFEPTELPGLDDATPSFDQTEPVAAPAAELDDADQALAEVVTPDFGAERHDEVDAQEESPSIGDDEPEQATAELETPEEEVAPDSVEEVDDDVAEATHQDHTDEPLTGTSPWARPQAWGVSAPAAAEAVAEPVAVPVEEPAYDAPAAAAEVEAPAAVAEAPTEEAPLRLQIRRPLTATAAASALEGDFVDDSEHSDDSTIFGQLRSNWLNDGNEEAEPWTPNEVDRGWDEAERAESTDAENTTRTGLPVRRPGGRLLPGGVSQEPAKVVRDPESIRNRLAAHAAGVSRGRAAAAAQPNTFDYPHEETGPA
jgi:hypothetical protein